MTCPIYEDDALWTVAETKEDIRRSLRIEFKTAYLELHRAIDNLDKMLAIHYATSLQENPTITLENEEALNVHAHKYLECLSKYSITRHYYLATYWESDDEDK